MRISDTSRTRARLLACLLVAAAACVLGAGPTAAESPTRTAWGLHRALDDAVSCRSPGRGRRCRSLLAPDAMLTLLEDTLALAYGDLAGTPRHGPRALHAQYRCQRTIARSVARFTGLGLVLRDFGWERPAHTPWTHRIFDALERDCEVEARADGDGLVIPSVGPQCAAAVGAAGEPVDVAALRGCFETLLTVWIERASSSARPLRPNIVLVLTDDQRFDTIDGRHGRDGAPVMPAVTRDLAGSGLSFSNAYVTTPVCCPSRASIKTGQYVSTHRVLRNTGTNGGALAFDDSSTVATWLHDSGYRTGFFGKYLNGYLDLRVARGGTYIPPGWDEWQAFDSNGGGSYFDYRMIENGSVVPYGTAESDYSTDVLAAKTLDFIDGAVADAVPFFAFFSPSAPHFPYIPAPRHAGSFLTIPFYDSPAVFEEDVSDKPAWIRNLPPGDFFRVIGLHGTRTAQLEMLQAVDEFTSDLMARLRSHGIDDDTLVVFFSDNGFSWAEHRWIGKACAYEECLRVPLVARYPRLVPLARDAAGFALGIDLAPTFAELAGASLPPGRDGRSLLRVLDGTDREPLEEFFFENFSGASFTYLGVRTESWKFIEHRSGERELYDLDEDPNELENRAMEAVHAERVDALRARILEFRPGWPRDAD